MKARHPSIGTGIVPTYSRPLLDGYYYENIKKDCTVAGNKSVPLPVAVCPTRSQDEELVLTQG